MMDRYVRQTGLAGFGEKSQLQLKNSRILVVGLGGLGLPAVQYLNAMGVGTLGLVDHDTVALHNLQRQVLYTEKDVGNPKVEIVLAKLKEQNSNTELIPYDTFLTKNNALDMVQGYDVILDATDNFPTRYLINDACVVLKKPFVYGALHGFEGHVSVFNHQNGPTYRCLYPKIPSAEEVPNCNENGVLGVLPGIVGTLQALETVKIITGLGEVLSGKLLVFDGLQQNFIKITFQGDPKNKKIEKLQDSYQPLDCAVAPAITAKDFLALRTREDSVRLLDVRSPKEFKNNNLEGSVNIPLNCLTLPKRFLREQRPIYVICQSGKRSELAVRELQKSCPELTFYHILGGMDQIRVLRYDTMFHGKS